MDRYRLLHPIGEGGMGRVYLAEDRELGRKVAVKFLSEDRNLDLKARERFRREAMAAAALDHPFICKVYEFGTSGERSFIAMEFVEGHTLEEELEEEPLSIDKALSAALEVAEAMDKAHGAGVLHRDLKPSNVMIASDGHIKVLDFGLARFFSQDEASSEEDTTFGKLTSAGIRVGTPYYMSPEQLRGEPADTRSDLFAFGVLLYEMLTGRHPFRRPSLPETLAAILNEGSPPIRGLRRDVPEGMAALVHDLMSKQASERPASFGEVPAALRRGGQSRKPPRPELAGRERELGELDGYLSKIRTRTGALVLLSGEPGVGKTRLAEEVLYRARDLGIPAFSGRCSESERGLPLLPFVETLEAALRVVPKARFRELLGESAPEIAKLLPELRSMYGDIPEPVALPPEAQRRFLFNSFLTFVERASDARGLVLFLDDVQWADESTLALLEHLTPHLNELPLLVLATYRDTEVDESLPFFAVLERLTRQRLAGRLALESLTEEAVGVMLTRLSGSPAPQAFARAFHARTEGNPFFVEEIYRQLLATGHLLDENGRWKEGPDFASIDVPEGVRLVIARRVERLDPATRDVLRTAAVMGRSFELDVLEALSNLADSEFLDAMEEAERAGLVQPSSSRPEFEYLFAHDLIRHALAERFSARRRQRLHLAIAESLERIYAGRLGERLEALAYHYAAAGETADRGKRLHYLLAAGEKALETASGEEAIRHLTSALEICPQEDEATRARILFLRGTALRVAVRWEDSFHDWLAALPLFERLGAGREAAQICEGLWSFYGWTDQWEQALEIAKRGLAVIADQRTSERARLLTHAALASDVLRAHEEAARLRTLGLEIARELKDERALGLHHFHVGTQSFYMADPETLVESSLEGARLLQRANDPWDWCPALIWAQFGHVLLGQVEGVQRLSDRALPEATRIGHLGTVAFADRNEAQVELMRTGDLRRFEARIRENIDLCRKIGVGYVAMPLAGLGISLLYQGRFEEALDVLREANREEQERAASPVGLGIAPAALLYGLAYARPEEARVFFDASSLRSLLEMRSEPYFLGEWEAIACVTEALAVLGEESGAAEYYRDLVHAIERKLVVNFWCSSLVQKTAGISAACAQEWDFAEKHFEAALKQAFHIPSRVQQPEIRRWYGWMLRRRGNPGDEARARELEREAAALYRELGMRKHVEMVAG